MTIEQYTKKVTKYLLCKKDRKKEIQRQLASDMESAVAEGKSIETVICEMGEPRRVAMEFNANMEPEAKKAAKRRRQIKWIVLIIAVFAVLAGALIWFLPKYTALEDSEEEAYYSSRTKQVISLIDGEDYASLEEYLSERMADFLTKEVVAEAKEPISSDFGSILSYGNTYICKVSQMNRRFVMVQINVSYENASVMYTVLFNEEGKVDGFYIR